MLCESCQASVPEKLLVQDEYKTASSSDGKPKKRTVCVLCSYWLPIGFNDCYGSLEYHQHRQNKAKIIRRMWVDLLDASQEIPPFLPQWGSAVLGR